MKKEALALFFCIMAILVVSCARNQEGDLKERHSVGPYVGNLHTHTIASDGTMTYHEAVDEAVRLKMDFLAITDHHTISTATSTFCPNEKRILCIIGEEISTKEGHMLAIGIKQAIPGGLSAQDTINRIHEQGGIAIAAHPVVDLGISKENLEKLTGLDAVECTPIIEDDSNNASCIYTPLFAHVFDSDAHDIDDLRRVGNRCELDGLDFASLTKAIKNGKCEVVYP